MHNTVERRNNYLIPFYDMDVQGTWVEPQLCSETQIQYWAI